MKKSLLIVLIISFSVGLYLSFVFFNHKCKELSDRTTCEVQDTNLREFKSPEYQIKINVYNL